MKLMFKTVLLACLMCVLPVSYAAEMNLNTFLGASPLQDLDVELDGKVVGVTGAQGELSTPLSGGSHTVRLMRKEVPLADFSFEVAEGESADLSISFTDFEKKPDITFDKYDAAAAVGGAPGVVEGYITDAEGYALPGATVRAEQAGVESVSNEDGAFRLEIPRGTYTLTVSHPEHETATQAGLMVRANLGTATQVALRPKVAEFGGEVAPAAEGEVAEDASAESATEAGPTITTNADGVQEITVVGTYRPAPRTAAVVERFSVSVTNAISIEDLLRSGDSDVAASLKRVVGVSISGGKYAVVRGLDGRYIASTLNGNLMPSTDPFRRDVELDLFPADILGGIEIQKSFSADMPGDTTGGIIKIKTRGLPDGYVNDLSGSIGYADGVTGEDLMTYEGGDSDAFGFDDGLRSIPGGVNAATNGGRDFSVCQFASQTNCVDRATAAALASSLPNIYNPKSESAAPNFSLDYSLGNLFTRDIGNVGVYGSLSYGNSRKSRQDAFVNSESKRSEYSRDGGNTTLSGYFVTGVDADLWSAMSKTTLLRSSEDLVEIEEGEVTGQDQFRREFLLEWTERQFFAQQFEGQRTLFDDHRLDWRVGVSQTTRETPDRRSYTYLANATPEGGFTTPQLLVTTVERSYADLSEDGTDLGLDYMIPLSFSDEISTEFQFGLLLNNRERESELIRLGFSGGSGVDRTADLESLFTPENFANGNFTLRASTGDGDAYDAEQDSIAYYLTTTTNIGEDLTLVAGLRQDEFSQAIEFPNGDLPTIDIDSDEALPTLAAIYRLNELQFRAGYSRTVSRPNITENAPTRFYDDRGREYIGCTANERPACETSLIDNFDLRAEYYFDGDRDSVSVAYFFKDIADPIERAVSGGSGSSSDALTFRNNEAATLQGIELDANWTAFEGTDHLLSLGGNLAFIESELKLGPLSRQQEVDPDRELQGQSPFLANFQIGYDHLPSSQKLTFLVNYFDDRIDIAARTPLSPIYELGRAVVNINYEIAFANQSKISFKIRNLLDDDIQYEQNGRVIESYKEGAAFSLGYSYKFGV